MIKKSSLGLVLMLVLWIQACSLQMDPGPSSIPTSRNPTENQFPDPVTDLTSSSTAPTQVIQQTRVLKDLELIKVRITAVDGNLFIRRGPHLAFDPIGVLYKGTSVSAIGRDVLSKWLQVEMTSLAGSMGWISIQTRYSVVVGEIKSLPVVDTTDWPVGAFIRNCTHHQMLAQPGDYLIPSSYEFPDNEVSVFPGTYSVYDLDVSETPMLIEMVELREGLEVDIREDADGERRKCP